MPGPILINGASGQLGTAFQKHFGSSALYVNRSDVDLDVPGAAEAMVHQRMPSVVVNCAAYTAVDRAEDEESLAFAVNGTAVKDMARACAAVGAQFITYSTDYVFDGTKTGPYVESDPTAPINAYGRSKLTGEHQALEVNPDCLIVRTSWVMSGTHRNFASVMLDLIERGPVTVVDDQVGRPTLVDDLALGSLALAEAGATGVVHMANAGVTSWFDLAQTIAAMAGLDAERVLPCSTAEYPTKASRPMNSVLASERIHGFGVAELPIFNASLERAVLEIQQTKGS